MISIIALLSLAICSSSLKYDVNQKHDLNNWKPVEPPETKIVNVDEDGEVGADRTRKVTSSDGKVKTLAIEPSSMFETTSNVQIIKAREVPAPISPSGSASMSHDLSDNQVGSDAAATPVTMTAVQNGKLARSQKWQEDAAKNLESGQSTSGWWLMMVLMVVGLGMAGFTQLHADMMKGNNWGKKPEPLITDSSVTLNMKARPAPAPLPKGITEVDVLETFDSYDKARRGFISRDELDGLLELDEGSQEKARECIGKVDKVFYHDFRRLVLQAGPLQNAVINYASRKRGAPVELETFS